MGTPDSERSNCRTSFEPHPSEIPAGQHLVRKPVGATDGRQLENRPTETPDATEHRNATRGLNQADRARGPRFGVVRRIVWTPLVGCSVGWLRWRCSHMERLVKWSCDLASGRVGPRSGRLVGIVEQTGRRWRRVAAATRDLDVPAGWVVVVAGGAGRVGPKWIGCPPLSRARVGTAVCSCAGGCPILCTPMTVRGRWCVERLGDRFLRRRWPTRPAIGRA